MDKIYYCGGCGKKVAILKEGSMLIKGITMLCPSCEIMRKSSDLASKTDKTRTNESDCINMFSKIFNCKL